MQPAEADYDAIEAALRPHQLRTLREYAMSQGLETTEWASHRLSRSMGIALAVDNIVNARHEAGLTERRAIAQAAAELNLDIDTLARQRRTVRARKRG